MWRCFASTSSSDDSEWVVLIGRRIQTLLSFTEIQACSTLSVWCILTTKLSFLSRKIILLWPLWPRCLWHLSVVGLDNQESEIFRIWWRSESLHANKVGIQCWRCVCWGLTCPLNHDLFRSIQTVFNLLHLQFDKSGKRSAFSQGTLSVNISSLLFLVK